MANPTTNVRGVIARIVRRAVIDNREVLEELRQAFANVEADPHPVSLRREILAVLPEVGTQRGRDQLVALGEELEGVLSDNIYSAYWLSRMIAQAEQFEATLIALDKAMTPQNVRSMEQEEDHRTGMTVAVDGM